MQLKAKLERARAEIAHLREEIRIKDSRLARIPTHRRPNYPPTERMAILEMRAACRWSLEQTATRFLVTAATISSWLHRVDEAGPNALVQTREPVNKFPDFVTYMVQRLKTLCPWMGKVAIAKTLARAGLHLGATTVGRMLKDPPTPESPMRERDDSLTKRRIVTAKYPGHLWHVDLTTLPILPGFWCPWLPFSLPQCSPFCWWIALAVDHFSRRIVAFAIFRKQPTSEQVRAMLGRAIATAGKAPRHLVCDKGPQFYQDGFKAWCKRKGIKPRFGAIGQHGSIAVIERAILTLKTVLRRRWLVPYRDDAFRREVALAVDWYNRFRPRTTLDGKTPNEVYSDLFPANRKPRFEPRSCWPRGSPCAKPQTLIKGQPGVQLELQVEYLDGRRHLPIVRLRRAA